MLHQFFSVILAASVLAEILVKVAALQHEHRREKMWDREVIDAENDVTGLCISFLLVQAVRFKLTGGLPEVNKIQDAIYSIYI